VAKKTKPKAKPERKFQPLRWLKRWVIRLCLIAMIVPVGVVAAHSVLNPPKGHYMRQEAKRLGGIDHHWVSADRIAPVMLRSVVAAEDAGFCGHWGFDMNAIRAALADGTGRGASTLTQQVVKNAYLWHGRNWSRKALEAVLTPVVELFWSKRRILEVYLNVAEFDEGIFGIEAASQHYFGVTPAKLSPLQAARLAAILPAPKDRSASRPSNYVRKRTSQIIDGAETIRRDGRADCFES
jgi:monofunctional glycosyltransferase